MILLVSLAQAEVPAQFLDSIKDQVIKQNPDWAEGEVAVKVKSGQGLFEKYAGDPKVKFQIAENYHLTKITPNLILPVVALTEHKELERAYVNFQIEVLQNVVVAKEKIGKGQLISEDKLVLEKKEVGLYPHKYFLKTEKVKDKAAAALIPAGTVILEWMVKDKPDVSRGQTVRILARSQGVEVWSLGVALGEGRIGENIKVKREGTKQKLEGKILSNEIVEVILP